MDTGLLESLGIPAGLPAAETAAAVVRRLPLRNRADLGGRDPATVLESRWFACPAECLNVLGEVCRGTPRRGGAFGASWPYLEGGGRILAPALPVAVVTGETTGPDGCYDVDCGVVWRESVGERLPFLLLEGSAESPEAEFDVLWFGDGERYVLRDGSLRVEDLFSMLRVSATAALVDRLLVRALRMDPDVLGGLVFDSGTGPATMEVRRPTALVDRSDWLDPTTVLRARADVDTVERRGDQLEMRTIRDETVVFNLIPEPNGWTFFRRDGEYPYRSLGLSERDGVLLLVGTIDSAIDPLAPGVRGRMAFDLRSNLVALTD